MANKLTTAQRNLVIEALNLDKAANYSRLEYYLKQIISGRDVAFETRARDPFVVSSGEAWEIIVVWSQSEGSLPVGDRKSIINARSRATKLLGYIQTNVSGNAVEAAANFELIKEQATNRLTPTFPSQDPQDYNLQKIYNLRHIQEKIVEAGIIGKIYTNLEKAEILKGVPEKSRNYVLRMLAAGHQNLRDPLRSEIGRTTKEREKTRFTDFTPEKIHQLLLHAPGSTGDINQIIRLFYSNSSQEEINTIIEVFETTISKEFKGRESEYQKEMSSFYSISSLAPGISSISYLVNCVDIHATQSERAAFAKSLRSQIISAASGNHHLSGEILVQNALRSAGLSDMSLSSFNIISSYIEEIEIKERHLLLGSNLGDHDSRLLATSSLAAEIGVDLTTPWVKYSELEKITERLTGSKSIDSLQKAFDEEFALGNDANLQRLSELAILMGKHTDYKIYQGAVGSNLGYKLQEMLSKGAGNYLAVRQPIDKFTQKTWGGISNIDDLIHYPQHRLAKWIEKTTERFPWLNPGAYIAGKWVSYQTGIALKIHSWAINLTTSTTTAWIKSFAGHISDFTEGFIKHEASWSGATTFFVQRKIGNVLDWSAKVLSKGKHATTKSLKISIANTIWSGFSKMAPELSAKMLAGTLGATIKTFLLGELTLGASIAIQVGWEAIKSGFSGLIKFIKSIASGDSSNLWGMGAMALGSLFLAFNTLLGGIPAALIVTFKILGTALKIIWDLFLALLALSAITAICLIIFFTLIWSGLINSTFNLDSNSSPYQQLVAGIICNEGGGGPGSAAVCIADYLIQCKLSPLNASLLSGSGWKCLLAQSTLTQNAKDAIEYSTAGNTYFQCVGMAAAYVGQAYNLAFPQINAKDYANNAPKGFKWASGGGSCQPGALFVDTGGTYGHIGVVTECANANIVCVDANYAGPGVTRNNDTCRYPTGSIAGYLIKI